MKKAFLSVFFFLCFGVASATALLYAGCVPDKVFEQKSLRDVYFSLRSLDEKSKKNSCKISAQEFLTYAERAVLAERFAEALWAAHKGINAENKKTLLFYQLKITEGRAFLGLERVEEAIAVFTPFTKNEILYSSKETRSIFAQAYLLLIASYYHKANKQIDNNVNYLIYLLKKKYPSAKTEIEILQMWLKKNGK